MGECPSRAPSRSSRPTATCALCLARRRGDRLAAVRLDRTRPRRPRLARSRAARRVVPADARPRGAPARGVAARRGAVRLAAGEPDVPHRRHAGRAHRGERRPPGAHRRGRRPRRAGGVGRRRGRDGPGRPVRRPGHRARACTCATPTATGSSCAPTDEGDAWRIATCCDGRRPSSAAAVPVARVVGPRAGRRVAGRHRGRRPGARRLHRRRRRPGAGRGGRHRRARRRRRAGRRRWPACRSG